MSISVACSSKYLFFVTSAISFTNRNLVRNIHLFLLDEYFKMFSKNARGSSGLGYYPDDGGGSDVAEEACLIIPG